MLINGEEGCENELNDSNFRDCFEKKKKRSEVWFFSPQNGAYFGVFDRKKRLPRFKSMIIQQL